VPLSAESLLKIAKSFDPVSRSRGAEYARAGRVLRIARSETPAVYLLQGEVKGSRKKPYSVIVEIEKSPGGTLEFSESTCTCPMEFDCKHGAALVYAVAENPGAQSTSPEEEAVSKWLQTVAQSPLVRSLFEMDSPRTAPRLLNYILRPSKTGLIVKLLAIGGGGRSENIHTYAVTGARAMTFSPEDVGLAQMLSGDTYECRITFGNLALFKAVLATGRAFWQKPGAGPLRAGPEMKARITWKSDGLGRQTPRVETLSANNLDLLPFDPFWYLDSETYECGPLDFSIPSKAVATILNAPPVPPQLAGRVDEKLRKAFPGAPLPSLQKLEAQRLEGLQPVPHLHIFETDMPTSFFFVSETEKRLNLARFNFDYGPASVSAYLDGPVVSKIQDGKLLEIVRDLPAEAKALDLFAKTGLAPIAEFLPLENREDLADCWSFGLQRGEWLDFSVNVLPELEKAGWRVTLDDSFRHRRVDAQEWYTDAQEEGNDWFGVELGVTVEGKRMNLLPMLEAFLTRNPNSLSAEGIAALDHVQTVALALPDGRALAVPAQRIKAIVGLLFELFNGDGLDRKGRLKLNRLRAAELPALQGPDWNWLGSVELKELGKRLRDFKGIAHVPPSANLQTTLRPYQQEGLNWLQFLREYDLGGALADDMGLGKTVQALAHLLAEKEAGRMDRPSLVVAPTSLMGNWRQEAEKFAPTLKTLVLHGLDRRNDFEKIREHDLVVTSYALLPRDEAVLLQNAFHCVILDEAQYIKNPKTRYAQVASALKARHRLCLTGTPMENHLGELWSLFNFALPGFLSDETRFRQAFRNPIEKHNDDARRKVLAHRIAPFILRRRKEDVATELPPKTEIIQNAELEGAQRDLYETIRLAMHSRVLAEVSKKGMSRSHIIILDALLKLRQVCCDPRLLPSTIGKNVKQSAKLELLMDLVPEMVSEGRRILLFSQFTSMLALIEAELRSRNIPFVILTGETRDRATPIARFQNGEVPVFLISLKAGGTGLNLTAADTVIHYDPWWNPAVENQATDRAHRIGQSKQVFVYKLIAAGTVEEKIVAMQARKKALVAGLLDDQQAEKLQLTSEDLEVLFAPLP
jgi:superfamily II DNA or RNA helicase